MKLNGIDVSTTYETSGVVRIESHVLFPIRGYNLLTVEEARELRNELMELLGEP